MDLLNSLVRVVRVIAMVAAAAFAFLLFVNEPQQPAPVPTAGAATGEAIFATRCASCHGDDGGGGFGPALAGGVVVSRFPDADDQAAIVANGRGSMPSFADSLTPEQVTAVVEYTRNEL
jgi:mono/diheme cytochrome c family protein